MSEALESMISDVLNEYNLMDIRKRVTVDAGANIVNGVTRLPNSLTIVCIAHRLNTVLKNSFDHADMPKQIKNTINSIKDLSIKIKQ